jgi:hypothetical protein
MILPVGDLGVHSRAGTMQALPSLVTRFDCHSAEAAAGVRGPLPPMNSTPAIF